MPLNENRLNMENHNFVPFEFADLESEPLSAEIVNAGDSLVIQIEYIEQERPIMYGGPLEMYGNYTLQQIYWHWIESTDPANELHEIYFPAELHLLFYITSYGSDGEYGFKSTSCLVLAFPFKVSRFALRHLMWW